ncbi:hypothetical protein F2Q70_00029883 [Brassica cretica]|uniref:Uncharacterized protein n=2 Tax=Brassica cretica TaxID=69181 RepID=A0A8S9FGU0_BRACR|nr:hypothetical protein F2Q70_00029883 [Brassica cretica]KAF2552915.1 hypothetical protein F2Q68_00034354 [Brassica cretica]KAF3592611.1 hypothetical protein DY000_02022131 [Brassica cretica]
MTLVALPQFGICNHVSTFSLFFTLLSFPIFFDDYSRLFLTIPKHGEIKVKKLVPFGRDFEKRKLEELLDTRQI